MFPIGWLLLRLLGQNSLAWVATASQGSQCKRDWFLFVWMAIQHRWLHRYFYIYLQPSSPVFYLLNDYLVAPKVPPSLGKTTLCFCHFVGGITVELLFNIWDTCQPWFLANLIPMQSTHSILFLTATLLREKLEDIPGKWDSVTTKNNECTFWTCIWCITPWLTFYNDNKHQARIRNTYLACHFWS